MITKDSLYALITLLDDPDSQIVAHISDKIKSYGIEVIPLLESAWENNELTISHQQNIEKITHEIQFDQIKSELKAWKLSQELNILDAWFILSKWQYPGIKKDAYNNKIEEIQKEIQIEIVDVLISS